MSIDFLLRVGEWVRRAAAEAGSIAPSVNKVSARILLPVVLATGWALSCDAASTNLPPNELLPAADTRVGRNGFVVIELFSSEGCSSCPSADERFNSLAAEARAKNLPLYCLAYHVDYWNDLRTPHGAWKDLYSSAGNSQRQSQYAGGARKRAKRPGEDMGQMSAVNCDL